MALRLILVSAVAGLGLSLPSTERLQGWGFTAQTWVHARLAEWDARMPADENAFVLVDEPTTTVAEATRPTPAAPQTPAAVAETSVPPVAPAAPPTEPAQALPDDLAAGLDVPIAPMAFDEPALAPARPLEDSLDAAFDAAQDDVVSSFAADSLAAATPQAQPEPRFEPIVIGDDLYPGVAFALNREAEGLDLSSPTAAPARSSPGFEPMVVGEDLYPGVAYALNREADGLRPTGPEAAATVARGPAPAPAGENPLTQAVRLTREAVSAWANVLHGPAVVIIAR